MNLRFYAALCMFIIFIMSCGTKKEPAADVVKNAHADSITLTGTWRLVFSKVIKGKDTLNTYPVKDQEMIKLFNGSHFAFFKHDVTKGKGSAASYESGAGTYVLSGNNYTEHLEYCNARGWEDKHFSFTLELHQDTLIQRGIEKIDSLNVNHEIVEAYIKVR
jgi:hypothetical protein